MTRAKRFGQRGNRASSATVRNTAYARLLDGLMHDRSNADLLACVRSAVDAHEATGMLVLVCA